ncbi:MAG TPA: hypothetical protein VFZ37_19495, partial [Jiangellaceae bacterium]
MRRNAILSAPGFAKTMKFGLGGAVQPLSRTRRRSCSAVHRPPSHHRPGVPAVVPRASAAARRDLSPGYQAAHVQGVRLDGYCCLRQRMAASR